MHRTTTALIAAALVSAPTFAGSIYKCVVDGQTTFSQMPCAPDAELIRSARVPAVRETIKWVTRQGEVDQASVDACLDLWRSALLDPRGAYVVEAHIRHPENAPRDLQLVLDASATIKAGGRDRLDLVCGLDAFGRIDEKDVEQRRAEFRHGLSASNY